MCPGTVAQSQQAQVFLAGECFVFRMPVDTRPGL